MASSISLSMDVLYFSMCLMFSRSMAESPADILSKGFASSLTGTYKELVVNILIERDAYARSTLGIGRDLSYLELHVGLDCHI